MDIVREVGQTVPPTGSGSSRRMVPNGGSHERRDVFHVSFDPEIESILEVVTGAVGVVHNEEMGDLDPLYEAVDPDALDELVAPSSDVDEVHFVYEGLEIDIRGDGNLWLQRE